MKGGLLGKHPPRSVPTRHCGPVQSNNAVYQQGPDARQVDLSPYSGVRGIMVTVSAELDAIIHEKRSRLKDAFAAYQKAREAAARGYRDLAEVASDRSADAQAEIQRLEIDEREAAARFNAISGEVAELHRVKYGEWHILWRGPRPSQ